MSASTFFSSWYFAPFSGRTTVATFAFKFHLLLRVVVDIKDPGHSAKSAGGRLQLKHSYTLRMLLCMKWHGASFCQKCRWQVTAKTLIHLMYVALHEVTWCMVVWCTQNLRRDGCSFMWHQPCQCSKYTTSVDIQKPHYKKLVTHTEPHASAVSLLKRAENSAI